MSKINVLPESVYNLISAGEVVENPASVVKELVENAIDAGADHIDVRIEEAGLRSIVVTDNGIGMEKDDLKKSVLPHATSKIACASDLNVIGTLGFRGEALASIAAVSETTIKSKFFESDVAYELTVKGGYAQDLTTTNLSVGTQISVNNLFFNTPPRFAFLKPPKSEESNVTSTMIDLIYANPDVSFSYIVDGTNVYHTMGEGLFDAIYSVYGAEFASEMIPIGIEEKGYRLSGFTARPATIAIRNNRTRQILIVNGRVIHDQTLSAVIQNAYGEFLMKRTFPSVVLDIVMPFDLVDVNVHPNKREVRFADKKVINGLVYSAIKLAVEKDAEERQKELFSVFHPVQESESVLTDIVSNIERETTSCGETDDSNSEEPEEEKTVSLLYKNVFRAEKQTDKDHYKVFRNNNSDRQDISNSFLYLRNQLKNTDTDAERLVLADSHPQEKPKYKIVGQLFETYLLIELGDEIILIDQHATHERILYDKLIEEAKKSIEVQDLLLPYEYPINPSEKPFFEANRIYFERYGFKIDILGKEIVISSVPCILTNLEIGPFLTELLEYNKTFSELVSSSVIKDKIAKIACKRAIKAGDRLTESQIEYVIEYFFKEGVPLQCPHGRPTMIKISRTEIEKRFGRIV